MSLCKSRTHVLIGDCQVKEGVPLDHLSWIGKYLVEQFAQRDVAIIQIGDFWDMPSLSSYDRGKRAMEGRRYKADIKAGNRGFDLLNQPLAEYNAKQRKTGKKQWKPELHLTLGNHEDRITRACEDNAQLEGVVSLDDLNAKDWGWTVHPYLQPVEIDGIHYAHFWYNPNTGRPYSGENLHLRLKTIGHTFSMGHQQGLNYAVRPVGNARHHGLVAGSCYLHAEKYLGPQSNNYWRGIVVKHQAEAGMYDPMMISLEYLCRRYEGRPLATFMRKYS